MRYALATGSGAALPTRKTPTSLPLFTIAKIPRPRSSRDYPDRVIDKPLDVLKGGDTTRME